MDPLFWMMIYYIAFYAAMAVGFAIVHWWPW